MEIIADLHLHGRFARGTSKALDIPNLEKWARVKGLNLLGTADFTHPEWFNELKNNLVKEQDGIYYTKSGFAFMLQTEISLIYTQDGKGRRIHNLVYAPSFKTVQQITEYLKKHGRVDYDGRPIFKIPCDKFVYDLKNIDSRIEIVPAHIWTPWFSLLGSKSGFNRVRECFREQTRHIHALETGLSSDPAMNWRLSELDDYTLISNSDTHSFWPWKLGRECNVFEMDKLSYDNVIEIFKTRKGFKETLEFFPEEGKYHYDGHRNCGVIIKPADAVDLNNICPVCGKPLTVGVMHRVEELADRPAGFKPENAVPFRSFMPLSELIAGGIGVSVNAKKTWHIYNQLMQNFGNEMNVLRSVSEEKLKEVVNDKTLILIMKNRRQEIEFRPGYDGEYGKPLFTEDDKKSYKENIVRCRDVDKSAKIAAKKQKSLTDFK